MSGTGRYLKERNKEIRIIGVDPRGSVYKSKYYKTQDRVVPYKIEGIGHEYVPGNLDFSIIDEIVAVSDKESFLMARKVARAEGILAGGSSGSAIAAALRLAKKLKEDDVIVVLLPDSGKSYISKIFNDEWMREHKFL